MKIPAVVAKLFHADGLTSTKVAVYFAVLQTAPKKHNDLQEA
jgi:hypothetical protein